MIKVSDLRAQRAKAYDAFKAIAEKADFKDTDQKALDDAEKVVKDIDGQIERAVRVQELSAASAQPVAGQEKATIPAAPETDPYVNDAAVKKLGLSGSAKSLIIGAMVKTFALEQSMSGARQSATALYGESHPVTKALLTSVATAGGFTIAPDFYAEIIELLRPKTVVRSSNPRVWPMPRGTMTVPGQSSAATASYGPEGRTISKSQPGYNQPIKASFKKLTGLVPIGNDMLRYAVPQFDASVRDDLVKVFARREDKAFLLDDGTQDTPKGMLAFARDYAVASGGSAGAFDLTGAAASIAANGGNFITSTAAYNLASAASELGGLANKLDSADVPADRRMWICHPRTRNYLYDVQNSLGIYVYREELNNVSNDAPEGRLRTYPIKTTTQIPTNLNDGNNHSDCSLLILTEMDEAIIFDAMQLEISISREGSYVDETGTLVSAFARDETLLRAIAEHDFHLRHNQAVAISQFVRWAPAIQ
ncbi:phage major capsid protein [Bradyrhizobium sp. SZCCHNRI1003]|uniref:phage major capsid protein n=1 Tax=Bradyrhizobium sp. SZCCHNRI1003 TaxID=3057275 RepID=UPI0029168657|nr:phage major capsid protein [Bradyrhizobium sp. SZCCHNRI1003]